MGGVQNSGRLPGGTYFSSNSCGEPTIPKWGDYSWVDHVIECPNLSLYHYFVYSHPPNIKHPPRNHGLVGGVPHILDHLGLVNMRRIGLKEII